MKPGDMVRVTNTITHLTRKMGVVVDVQFAGDCKYIRILVDGVVSRIIPGHWVEVIQ